MYILSTLITLTTICIISAMIQRTHILMMLLNLEACILMIVSMYALHLSLLYQDSFILIPLTVAVAHAASALALLATLTRAEGTTNTTLSQFNQFHQ